MDTYNRTIIVTDHPGSRPSVAKIRLGAERAATTRAVYLASDKVPFIRRPPRLFSPPGFRGLRVYMVYTGGGEVEIEIYDRIHGGEPKKVTDKNVRKRTATALRDLIVVDRSGVELADQPVILIDSCSNVLLDRCTVTRAKRSSGLKLNGSRGRFRECEVTYAFTSIVDGQAVFFYNADGCLITGNNNSMAEVNRCVIEGRCLVGSARASQVTEGTVLEVLE